MKFKWLIAILVLAVVSLSIHYLIKLHKDNVIPFMKYKSESNSLEIINGSSFYYLARLDTTVINDTLIIAVYGRLPILILNSKRYDSFQKAHIKVIKVPENIKYIEFNKRLFTLDSIKLE